jgi:hypothetical protein
MKEDFIAFLVKNKAYRQFMHNLAYCEKGMYSWDKYSYETPAEEWIVTAFFFNDSKEGHDFWMHLHYEWQRIIK